MNVLITDIIHSDFAVSTDDGNRIYELIDDGFSNKKTVILNFQGVTLMTTAFLNAAIGQLYSNEKYSSDFLNDNISLVNVSNQDKYLFGVIIERAKKYFENKEGFEKNTHNSIYGND